MKNKNFNKGQTLIETLTGLFILVTGISAAVSLAIFAFGSSSAVLKQITATGLAREGLEAVRNMRDTNWLNDTLVKDGCYSYTDPTGRADCYTNWLGDKASPAVPFCLNPSLSAGGATAISGSALATGIHTTDVYFNGALMGSSSGYRVYQSGAIPMNGLTFGVGKNVLAAYTVTSGEPNEGFIADITLGGAKTGTDITWKVYKGVINNYVVTPPPDQSGPGNTTLHWYDVGYDDSSWKNAYDAAPYSPVQYGFGTIPNFPATSTAHWIWYDSILPFNYNTYFRGTFSNTSCSGNLPNVPASYSFGLNSTSNNPWTSVRTDTNFALSFNNPSASGWQQGGFFSQSANACDNSSGNSDFCRRVILTKVTNTIPYDKDPNMSLLKVQSQVWWVDKKCPRVATFDAAPNSCKIELDSYLTNWKF